MQRKKTNRNFYITYPLLFLVVIGIFSFLFFTNEKVKYCNNEKVALRLNDTLKVITFDSYNEFPDDLIDEISVKLNKNTCCNQSEFLLQLESNELISLALFDVNCKDCEILPHWSFNELLINRDNQILLNYNIVKVDSIEYKVLDFLKAEHDGYYDFREDFAVMWDKTAPKKTIEMALSKIKKGYLLFYEDLCQRKFDKELCSLSEKELNEIDFEKSKLFIGFGLLKPVHPPPPPPSSK